MFQYSLTGKDGAGSGFGSWKTVPAAPVPLSVSGKTPDLLFLVFWISLLFAFLRNSLLFCAFFPSFPRILGVRQGLKILVFLVVFLAVFQKSKEKKIRDGSDGSDSRFRFGS